MQLQKRIGNKTDLVLPKVYGMVRTDIGTGLCVELVLDDDGNISKTLKQAVRSTSVTPEVKNAIQDFFCKLLELGIEIKDPGISNIALKKDSTGQISAKLIDGFGTHSILPLSRWFTSIRTRRIQAKINKISARSGISTTKG